MSARSRVPARLVAALTTTSLLLAACSGSDEATPPSSEASTTVADTTPSGPPFVLGYLRPATGLLTELAQAQERAIGLAVEDINAAGGVGGTPVTTITADEPADGDIASAIDQLQADGASIVLGPVGSTSAQAAIPALERDGMIACSASATAPSLTTSDTTGVLYRTAMSDSYTVTHVADVLEADAKAAGSGYRVAVVARTDDYGIGFAAALTSVLLARGIDASIVGYPARRVVFDEEVAAVKALQPSAVVLASYGESVRLVDALVAGGVPVSSLVGLDGMMNPRLGSAAFPDDPTKIDGMRVIGSTGDRAFIERLAEPEGPTQVAYGAQMYDCAVTAALAAEASGSVEPTGYAPQLTAVTSEGRPCSTYTDCLGKLEAGEDIDYQGVSGGVHFDAAGDATEVRFSTVTFRKGALEEVDSVDFDVNDIRQQEAIAGAIFVARLQQALFVLGFYSGPIDGQYSDATIAAVGALQASLGLPVTGLYDATTDAAARAKYGAQLSSLNDSVIGLQTMLTALGYYSGPIDGQYSDATIAAIRALQADLGVPQTGIIDAATLAAAYAKGLVGTTTTTVGPTTTVPTTEPATTVAPTTPPVTTAPGTTVPTSTTMPPAPEATTILGMLRQDERFSTLVEILTAAGYVDDVRVPGPITFFAPTNDAFADMTKEQIQELIDTPMALSAILAYHLVEGEWGFAQLATLTDPLETVHGESLTFARDAENVLMINGTVATVEPQIDATNGIIVPITSILMPKVVPTPR